MEIRAREKSPEYDVFHYDVGDQAQADQLMRWLLERGEMCIQYPNAEYVMIGLPQRRYHYWVHKGYRVLANVDTVMGVDSGWFEEKFETIE
jgi:hypothetical protein